MLSFPSRQTIGLNSTALKGVAQADTDGDAAAGGPYGCLFLLVFVAGGFLREWRGMLGCLLGSRGDDGFTTLCGVV